MTEYDLKKQTQFSKGQNDVKSISIMIYGDFDGPERRKNKANSKPIVFFTAENAEFAEQKRLCVSDCPIKKYNLYHPSLRS